MFVGYRVMFWLQCNAYISVFCFQLIYKSIKVYFNGVPCKGPDTKWPSNQLNTYLLKHFACPLIEYIQNPFLYVFEIYCMQILPVVTLVCSSTPALVAANCNVISFDQLFLIPIPLASSSHHSALFLYGVTVPPPPEWHSSEVMGTCACVLG